MDIQKAQKHMHTQRQAMPSASRIRKESIFIRCPLSIFLSRVDIRLAFSCVHVHTLELQKGEILERNGSIRRKGRIGIAKAQKAHAHKNIQIEAQRNKKREGVYALCLPFSSKKSSAKFFFCVHVYTGGFDEWIYRTRRGWNGNAQTHMHTQRQTMSGARRIRKRACM